MKRLPFAFAFAFTFSLTFTFAFTLAGCTHRGSNAAPCAPGLPSLLEVRDGAGALELALKQSTVTPGELDLCDPQAKRIGRLVSAGDALQLLDGDGQLVARLHRDGPDDLSAEGPKGPLLRVHSTAQETRVLKPDGVPFGSVAPTDGGATLYSPGSAPIGSIAPHDQDQVIAAADGASEHYVKPASSSLTAGLLGIEGLPLPVRVALYRFISIKAR